MTFRKFLPWGGVLFLFLVILNSCQEDFGTIGSEVIGSESPNGILDDSHTIISYSKQLSPVQTNRIRTEKDLPLYQLGVYNDHVFGKSTINFLTQLRLESNNPKFGKDATVDSVYAYLPYFSTGTEKDSIITYKLDSIFGNTPIKVSILESNYFLRDFDPDSGFEKGQPYYSDQGPLFESFLGQELASVADFKPSANGYVIKIKDEKKNIKPGLRIALPVDYFQQKIIAKEGSQELMNNNNFRNYMRGLYFKVEAAGSEGNLFLFDASESYVEMFYSFENQDDPEVRDTKSFKLNFGGIYVNTYDNEPLPGHIQADLDNPDTISGNKNLYLRGGEGIISVVELFGEDLDNNGVADELELLRAKKWMINEANLKFYVNQELMAGAKSEPERIMIYDLKNSNVLADYNFDPTNGLAPSKAYTTHFGKLERGNDGKGVYYKLKITNHISNLINKDSTNVPLGIVVSNNVKNKRIQKLSEPLEPCIKNVPASTVVSHEGTILHGNTSPNSEKRLKLQIYYTKPE